MKLDMQLFTSSKALACPEDKNSRRIRNDFKGHFPDTSCPIGCGEEDTLKNIILCKVSK